VARGQPRERLLLLRASRDAAQHRRCRGR
jgi:hypothetical protein